MRLATFIRANLDPIENDWENFARTLFPAAAGMDRLALKDHSIEILLAIADDLETKQSPAESETKSLGLKETKHAIAETAARTHGELRQKSGFDLVQLASEYRALRASVLRLWGNVVTEIDASHLADVIRFNEAVDEALAQSIETYSAAVNRTQSLFLGILGHDIRTPLNVIRTYAEVIALHASSDAIVVQGTDRIRRNTAIINNMATDLLEFVRMRIGNEIEVTYRDADLEALCREIVEDFDSTENAKVVFHSSGDLTGQWDVYRLGQVFRNLISNALQHGTKGAEITIDAEGRSDAVSIVVENRGRMIPSDIVPNIFEPMVRFGRSNHTDGEQQNIGLGLFIVREIVTAHGGTVDVDSTPEQTRFTVVLSKAH